MNSKEWYQKNKEKQKQNTLRWKQKNPLRFAEISKKRRLKWSKTPKGIYHVIKTNTKKRGIYLLLNQQEFIDWYNNQPKTCTYCGISEIDLGKRLEIDRKNNLETYTINNMVLACKPCNSIKSDIFTFQEMKLLGEVVTKLWKIRKLV